MSLAKSDKLAREEAAVAEEVRQLDIPTIQRDSVIKILPLTTLNDWVVILRFAMESTVLLPASMEYLDRGIVVGVSESILTPEGRRVKSQLRHGDVVLFQEKSKVKDLDWPDAPYQGKRLIIISERNLFLRLPPVEFEMYEQGKNSASDFTVK